MRINNSITNNRAVIYSRYSSDNQRDESIEAQDRACKELATKHGLRVIKIYSDRAKSATSDKRPEFQQMMMDSGLGLFDYVIVHKLDRFSRDRYDSAYYKRLLKKNNIKLLSVTENLDDSPESLMLETLLEGMAEYYSKNLAREVMKGMKENAYKCRHTGGIPPLGYDIDPMTKQYVINEEEAETVRKIYSMYLSGLGYVKIIDHLNTNGCKTKIGRPFGKNSIHDILINEKYCGTFVFNKTFNKDPFGKRNGHRQKPEEEIIKVPDGVPAIISEEDFVKAKTRMDKNKHQPGRYKSKEIYLLSGLIFCGECGQTMHGNVKYSGRNKKKHVTYRCCNRERTKQCDNKELRREYIESYVLSELEAKLFNDEAIPYLVEKLNKYQVSANKERSEHLKTFEHSLNEINTQISNIINAIAKGFAQDSFKQRLEELEDAKTQTEARIREIQLTTNEFVITEEALKQLFGTFKQYIVQKDIPECKKFIDSYVEKVLVYKDHVEVTFKVAFSLQQKEDVYRFTSSSSIKKLFKSYRLAV